MKTLDPDDRVADAMMHPRHQVMQQELVPLIEQVRACCGGSNAFSRAVKRMAMGGKPQPGAPGAAIGPGLGGHCGLGHRAGPVREARAPVAQPG
ncbi:hypothetical protein ACH47Z_39655 [Streptomyces sp. NPDC020192]|uniref:hypothetical protein n=1 Tax=Streptomyces sp. NPDC020192 TaxID=3365066 RepID=UPI0037A7552E